MSYPQFIDLVSQMRSVQKLYFKTREKKYLEESKELEKKVDNEIKLLNKEKEIQSSLFGK